MNLNAIIYWIISALFTIAGVLNLYKIITETELTDTRIILLIVLWMAAEMAQDKCREAQKKLG